MEKIKEIPACLTFLVASVLQKKIYVDDNSDDCFPLIHRCYWTVYDIQANSNYTFSFKYHSPYGNFETCS
jgi:hypothetical protein